MVGCFIGLFVKCKVLCRIRYLKSTKIKTGFGGNAGNKGAVAIRFFIDDTSMMFVNCHLLSGRRKGLKRVEEMKKILESAFANESTRDMCAEKYDNIFIFGDLNFRVNLPNDQVRLLVFKKEWKSILNEEDFTQIFKHGALSAEVVATGSPWDLNIIKSTFIEGKIDFAPTYKFDKRSINYDTSKK